eukprot:g27696.t1
MPCWLSSFRCFPGCTAAQDLLQGQLAGGVELQGHEVFTIDARRRIFSVGHIKRCASGRVQLKQLALRASSEEEMQRWITEEFQSPPRLERRTSQSSVDTVSSSGGRLMVPRLNLPAKESARSKASAASSTSTEYSSPYKEPKLKKDTMWTTIQREIITPRPGMSNAPRIVTREEDATSQSNSDSDSESTVSDSASTVSAASGPAAAPAPPAPPAPVPALDAPMSTRGPRGGSAVGSDVTTFSRMSALAEEAERSANLLEKTWKETLEEGKQLLLFLQKDVPSDPAELGTKVRSVFETISKFVGQLKGAAKEVERKQKMNKEGLGKFGKGEKGGTQFRPLFRKGHLNCETLSFRRKKTPTAPAAPAAASVGPARSAPDAQCQRLARDCIAFAVAKACKAEVTEVPPRCWERAVAPCAYYGHGQGCGCQMHHMQAFNAFGQGMQMPMPGSPPQDLSYRLRRLLLELKPLEEKQWEAQQLVQQMPMEQVGPCVKAILDQPVPLRWMQVLTIQMLGELLRLHPAVVTSKFTQANVSWLFPENGDEIFLISLIFQEVCREPMQHSPDLQQLLWFLPGPPSPSTLRALLKGLSEDGGYLMSLWACLCHWSPQGPSMAAPAWNHPGPPLYALLRAMLVAFAQLPDSKRLCRSALVSLAALGTSNSKIASQVPALLLMLYREEQQDVTETIRFVFDKLGGSDQLLLKEVFAGQLQEKIQCKVCGNVKVREETFTDLVVPVPTEKEAKASGSVPTAQKLLDERLKYEDMDDDDNLVFCEVCQKNTRATKWSEITSPPAHLCLCLNRFTFNMEKMDFTKEKTPVKIDESLFIGGYEYELYHTIIHTGKDASSGHYYAMGKRSEPTNSGDTGFYTMDDSQIKPAEVSLLAGNPPEKLLDDNAYVLFLRCKQAPPTPELRVPLPLLDYVKEEDKKQ